MIKRNSNFLTEVFTEEWDLGISLAEVVEHDELCTHLHPSLNRLRGCAAKEQELGTTSPSHTAWLVLLLQGAGLAALHPRAPHTHYQVLLTLVEHEVALLSAGTGRHLFLWQPVWWQV